MTRMRRKSIVSFLAFLAVLSLARAQRGDYGDYGYGGRDDNYYHDNNNYYGRQQQQHQDDNLIANYAAGKEAKALGGWPRLIMTGIGGYLVGATVQTFRLKRKGGSAPKLRFKVKQRVRCNMGGGQWLKGTIIKLWPQEAQGSWMPYRVKLDNGSMIFAPVDTDTTIQALK